MDLPEDVIVALQAADLPIDEVDLRQALERQVKGWNLFCLTPVAAKRWKCRYRVLMDAGYYDGMTASEAYARALLAVTVVITPQTDQQGDAPAES